MTNTATKPAPTDFAPYYGKYVSLVPDGDIVQILERQGRETTGLLGSLSPDLGNFRYGTDKWSVKELVGHVADTERIFAYRALRFARNDQIPLAGFEQNDYVLVAGFDRLPLSDLIEDFENVRRSTIGLFRSLDEAAWERRGVASENEVTVRALAHIIAGHELHHMGILRERYLKA
jgi:hypothetical protein